MKGESLLLGKVESRFWSKVNKDGKIVSQELGSCWEWTAGTNYRGYGNFSFKNKTYSAYRVAWIITNGTSEKWILHKCDNPACVRPSHLFEGSALENNRDCNRKGRRNTLRGEDHQDCKLTDAQILEISGMQLRKGMYAPLVKKYGVGYKTLWSISRGKYPRQRRVSE